MCRARTIRGKRKKTRHHQVHSESKRKRVYKDPEKQRELAARAGRAAQQSGRAHRFDSEEAREAGRISGLLVSQDRSHMSELGRLSAEKRAARELQAVFVKY